MRQTRLDNSLNHFQLTSGKSASIKDWYKNLGPNEITFPKDLADQSGITLTLSRKVMLMFSLNGLVNPLTLPKVGSKILKNYPHKGYALTVTSDLIEEVSSSGNNPNKIKAVTGFQKTKR